jgi:hypothetical protein
MEEATGTKLSDFWLDIDLSSKLKMVESLVMMQKKFLSVSFTRSVRSIKLQIQADN